jgi:hypothetical protein
MFRERAGNHVGFAGTARGTGLRDKGSVPGHDRRVFDERSVRVPFIRHQNGRREPQGLKGLTIRGVLLQRSRNIRDSFRRLSQSGRVIAAGKSQ